MGVASVALVYDLVRRRFGRVGGFVAGLSLGADADRGGDLAPQQPRRAAGPVQRGGAVVHGARALERPAAPAGWCWRACALASASRRRWSWRWSSCRASSRHGCGSPRPRAGRAARAAPAAGRRRGVAARGRRVAVARGTHARGRSPVGVGHEQQQRPVADLRIQRPRARRRPDGRPRRARRATMFGGTAGSAAPVELGARRPGRLAAWLCAGQRPGRSSPQAACAAPTRAAAGCWRSAARSPTTAVLFSFASGIFHPYYVSLLAPFAAALVGAGAAQLIDGGRGARMLGPLAVAAAWSSSSSCAPTTPDS